MHWRYIRFNVRTLAIVITLLCVWLGIIVERSRRQAAAVAEIQAMGCIAVYDFEYVFDAPMGQAGQSWVPTWILDRTGPDLFHSVASVGYYYQGPVPPSAIDVKRQLAAFPHLRALALAVPNGDASEPPASVATDEILRAVGRLHNLEWLLCDGASDVGAAHLSRLQRLRTLHMDYSHQTDASLSAFGKMRALHHLEISGDNYFTNDGLALLANLKHLESLYLGDDSSDSTGLTDAGLHKLYGLSHLSHLALVGLFTVRAEVDLRRAMPALDSVQLSRVDE